MELKFSYYEQNMIRFLMDNGFSEALADQTVVDERVEQFNDMHHQLTYENQLHDLAPIVANENYAIYRMGNSQQEKIRAFRRHIGEEQWRNLCGDTTNTILLTLAIDFRYEG